MARRLRSAAVGAFVLGALALLASAIVIWGGGRWFRSTYDCVCYFDGSVNGLAKGAAVKFRGVKIGWVQDIRMRYRQAAEDRRIPVLIALDAKRVHELVAGSNEAPIAKLVSEGLHARLESESLVSGQLYVGLQFQPNSAAAPTQEAEIPTLPNGLEEASTTVMALLERLRRVDFEGIGRSMANAADGVAALAGSRELHAAVTQMPALIRSVRRLTTDLDSHVGATTEELRAAARDARSTLAQMRTTLERADRTLAPQGPLVGGLSDTLQDLDRAARAVRELAESLERNPSSLLLGRKER
jgi:paraquat-inducible protein B